MPHTLTRNMAKRHLRATRAVGFAFVLADRAGWYAASTLFAIHLRPPEIVSLAVAALSALDDDIAEQVIDFAKAHE